MCHEELAALRADTAVGMRARLAGGPAREADTNRFWKGIPGAGWSAKRMAQEARVRSAILEPVGKVAAVTMTGVLGTATAQALKDVQTADTRWS